MKKKNKNNTDYSLAHVLYQKLGNDWYAFTEVDGDCFMSKVDSKVVEMKNFEADSDSSADKKKKLRAA